MPADVARDLRECKKFFARRKRYWDARHPRDAMTGRYVNKTAKPVKKRAA